MTEIEALTFAFCPSLKLVEFRGTKAQWDAVKHKVNLFSFSAAKIKAVKCSDSVWEKPILLVEDGSAVCLDSNVTNVVIPEGVKEIANGGFFGCKRISSVEFGGTVAQWETVKGKANLLYYTSAKIKAVKCSNGDWEKPVILVEDGVCWCLDSSVTNVVIPEGVKEIAYGGFFDCERISSVEFGGTVAQWEEIEKGEHWNDGVPAKFVKCSDGDVAL